MASILPWGDRREVERKAIHRDQGDAPALKIAQRSVSQGETIEELTDNLKEVITMLRDDGEPVMEAEYIGTQTIPSSSHVR